MNNSIQFYGSWGHVVKQALAASQHYRSACKICFKTVFFCRCETSERKDKKMSCSVEFFVLTALDTRHRYALSPVINLSPLKKRKNHQTIPKSNYLKYLAKTPELGLLCFMTSSSREVFSLLIYGADFEMKILWSFVFKLKRTLCSLHFYKVAGFLAESGAIIFLSLDRFAVAVFIFLLRVVFFRCFRKKNFRKTSITLTTVEFIFILLKKCWLFRG
jgi:hypothetical protein